MITSGSFIMLGREGQAHCIVGYAVAQRSAHSGKRGRRASRAVLVCDFRHV